MRNHDEVNDVSEVTSEEGGCAVDWSWLEGLTIASATSDLQHWHVRFSNGLTLTIQASLWNAKPFLAFKPYQAPAA